MAELFTINSTHTDEELAQVAASLGLNNAKDLQAPPRKDYKKDMGYILKVKSVEFKSDENGDAAKLSVVPLDGSGNEVKGAPRQTIFVTFPWETESFKFKDLDMRSRAMNDFKALLLIARPDARLVKKTEVAGVVSYYNAQTDEKLDAKVVKQAYTNEEMNVSILGREMQQKQDVAAFAGMTIYAVFNVYENKLGETKSRFQRFSASPLSNVTYLTDPAGMFTRGQEDGETVPTAGGVL